MFAITKQILAYDPMGKNISKLFPSEANDPFESKLVWIVHDIYASRGIQRTT